jgi:hypothetical protein
LPTAQVASLIDAVTGALRPSLEAGLPVAGLMSLGFSVGADGRVRALTVLADTTRTVAEEQRALAKLRRTISAAVRAFRFPKQRGPSRVTLPLVFER